MKDVQDEGPKSVPKKRIRRKYATVTVGSWKAVTDKAWMGGYLAALDEVHRRILQSPELDPAEIVMGHRKEISDRCRMPPNLRLLKGNDDEQPGTTKEA